MWKPISRLKVEVGLNSREDPKSKVAGLTLHDQKLQLAKQRSSHIP